MMNVTHHRKNVVEDYYFLIANLSDEDKIKLIARISDSLVKERQKPIAKTKKEILHETYGSFQSSKTADELIDEIHRGFGTR